MLCNCAHNVMSVCVCVFDTIVGRSRRRNRAIAAVEPNERTGIERKISLYVEMTRARRVYATERASICGVRCRCVCRFCVLCCVCVCFTDVDVCVRAIHSYKPCAAGIVGESRARSD